MYTYDIPGVVGGSAREFGREEGAVGQLGAVADSSGDDGSDWWYLNWQQNLNKGIGGVRTLF
jgi:hypothetical protein